MKYKRNCRKSEFIVLNKKNTAQVYVSYVLGTSKSSRYTHLSIYCYNGKCHPEVWRRISIVKYYFSEYKQEKEAWKYR